LEYKLPINGLQSIRLKADLIEHLFDLEDNCSFGEKQFRASNSLIKESIFNGCQERGFRRPNRRQLYYHFKNIGLDFHKNRNIFTMNSRLTSKDRYVLLVDIDCKNSAYRPAARQMAAHINHTYLQGQGMLEPSSSGVGYHLYFIVPHSTAKT